MLPVVGLFKTWHWVVGCLSFHKLSTTSSSKPSWQRRSSHSSLLAPCRKHQKHIAQILLASYFSMPGVLLAQGATAANTAHAPSFDTAANGVPIVNINAPSAQGVSRNEYDQLNVDAQGLIFNNSTSIVQTQLAGHVDGNKHLGGKSASIILNEVMGNRRSALNGYMEIAGQRAQLIIANQHGITCNGCGFINTSRGMLTTGASVFDAFGNLSGFDVSRGNVDITGLGFNDTDTDEVDILARSVSLNANMWANQATIITGDNLINYNDKSVTSRSTGEKTGFSLDVAAIGGMYANRIRLIGTEKGLGVNLSGKVSGTESMVLDTQGNLVNKVSLSSKQLSLNANNITNTGELLGDKITLTANDLENTGSKANIQASNTMNITLQGTLNNQDSAKIQTPNGQLTLNANLVNNQSTLAANQLTLIASQLDNHTENGSIFGTDKVDLTLTGALNNRDRALIQSDKQLVIRADGNITNRNATLGSVGSATIRGQNLENLGAIKTQDGRLTMNVTNLVNRGRLAGHGLTITTDVLDNSTEQAILYSTDTLDLTVTGEFTNKDSGLIHADKALTLTNTYGDLFNTNATIESITDATISSQNLTNSGTVLAQNGTLTINTGVLNNDGAIKGKNIKATASVIHNDEASSRIAATGDLTLDAIEGNVNNLNGAKISANNTLTINAKETLKNTDSTLESVDSIHVTSRNLNNNSNGTISAQNGTLSVTSDSVNNNGGLAGTQVTINAKDINNAGSHAFILAKEKFEITSTGGLNNTDGGVFYSLGDGEFDIAGVLTNSSATIETHNDLTIKASKIANRKRAFSASESVSSQAYNNVGIGVPGGYYQATRNYTQTTTTPYIATDSPQAYLLSGGNMTITGAIDNLYSTVSAVGNLSFTASQLNNVSYNATGKIVSTGTDYLSRTWETCKRNWYGKKKCTDHYATDTRGYNSTSFTNVVQASATFTAGGNITGKAGSVDNKGKVGEVEKAIASKDPLPSASDESNDNTLTARRDDFFKNVVDDLMSSALYALSTTPNPPFLIETNPLLTNYQHFISSDYLLNKLTSDAAGRNGKVAVRLGDGFLEQKLVRDQLLSLTGKQTIPDSMSMEDTFTALMNNAVDFYQELGLSTGIALSAEQIAQLQQPIVWMVTETVDTPNGPQQALVPKVYFSAASGLALRPDGALMAASSIELDVENGITNSGTMLATVDLSLKGSSIDNAGTVKAGGNASLTAASDITNSGTIHAGDTLGLVAGGNIISETKTTVLQHQRGAIKPQKR
ncbi:hypothetical protein A8139_11955 [Marinomonas primoryensis]|uniref:Filamentous haemagglutinin FhaB/tRNA nuclease CdiA-like TPS domain-containing protein n=1 Tax=Marinomonas primoryensis TaxID=178399 RepID=A0A2Z4PU20_9GAMM|nr:filamentous hemagglutinin N-terminal domain-containing protein [Marinomonas primoryensis]AWY00619.1 hypothetical protein A8139_11955 [Marinomonas primoryensis]